MSKPDLYAGSRQRADRGRVKEAISTFESCGRCTTHQDEATVAAVINHCLEKGYVFTLDVRPLGWYGIRRIAT